MKILLMGPISPPYTGQSVAFTSIVNAIRKDKYDCTIINISDSNSILGAIKTTCKIIYLSVFNKYDRVYFTCSRSFLGSVRDILLIFFNKRKQTKIINHLHGANFKTFFESQSKIYRKILTKIYKKIDVSIVLLEEMKDQFSSLKEMNVYIVQNGYDFRLDSMPKEKAYHTNSIQILYLSNIMHSKGIVELMNAFERILNKNDSIKLKIAGLPIKDHLSSEREIKDSFLSIYNRIKGKYKDNIEYLGVIAGDFKNKTLWESDIFILPTYYPTEAFPISIIEAMRAGNYIISTKHNYIPSIISDSNGTLVTPKSTDDIYHAISDVIADRAKLHKIQNYNIKYTIENFREDIYISGTLAIIYNN